MLVRQNILCLLFVLLTSVCLAQRDSIKTKTDTTKSIPDTAKKGFFSRINPFKKKPEEQKKTSSGVYKDSTRLALEALPAKRAFQSAILPGLGQWNNGGFWNRYVKIPAIYGGFVSIGLVYNFNNYYYHRLLKEAQFRLENPNKSLYYNIRDYPTEGIVRAKDTYRRNRDFTILVGLGFHGIQIIDAYIFAKFKRFDISDDLGMTIKPTAIYGGGFSQNAFSYYPGLKFSFALK